MNKKGISLVVLIITIVVLVILTSIVVINSDDEIIDETSNIVNENNRKALIDEIAAKILVNRMDKQETQYRKFTIAEDVIPILSQYGQYNNSTLELITQDNMKIMLYEIFLIPIDEYITTQTVNGGIDVQTDLSTELYEIEYSIDNAKNWITYNTLTGINSSTAILRIVDSSGKEISDRLEVNQNNQVSVIDTRAPIIFVSPINSNIISTTYITISVLDSGGLNTDNIYKYCLAQSQTPPADDSDLWAQYENGEDVLIGEGLNGTYYLHVMSVKDTSNNESGAYVSSPYVFDNIDPTISVTVLENGNGKCNITVNISDDRGLDLSKCRYKISQSDTSLGNNASAYTDGNFEATNTILEVGICGQYYLHAIVTDEAGNSVTYTTDVIEGSGIEYGTVLSTLPFSCTGGVQTASLSAGKYKFEVWGAQGNDPNRGRASGGKGAYTSGLLELTSAKDFFVYVGQHRTDRTASFNAGSTGGSGSDTTNSGSTNGYGGGGATDFRVSTGNWNDAASLRTRIMVAAGGGGATDYAYPASGGYGGALTGGNGINAKYPSAGVPNVPPTGATQTTGGATSTLSASGGVGVAGTFGIGGNGNSSWGSGGGGGYYGGAGGGYTSNSVDSGAGGSSFISGHPGCNAVNSAGTHTGGNAHYLGYVFGATQMLAGNEQMPTPTTNTTAIGNTGNGYAKITQYEPGFRYINKISTNNLAWDGTANIQWYVSNTGASTYNISNASELAGLALLTQNVGTTVYYNASGFANTTSGAYTTTGLDFAGKTINITQDINLNDGTFSQSGGNWYYTPNGGTQIAVSNLTSANINTWIPGGTFAGTLNGQGHTIEHLYFNGTTGGGLFTGLTGTIKNICMDNEYITSTTSSGGILGGATNGVIDSCCVINSAIIAGNTAGGICVGVGANGVVANSYNTSMVKATSSSGSNASTGGISSDLSGSGALIINCYNSGAITGMSRSYGVRVGGIVGEIGWTGGNVYNVYNVGALTTARGQTVGYAFTAAAYLYGLSSIAVGVTGSTEGGSYSSASLFSGSGTTWTLATAVSPNGTSTTSLIDALNAWVTSKGGVQSGVNLSTWVADTTGKNNGYPIFSWQ